MPNPSCKAVVQLFNPYLRLRKGSYYFWGYKRVIPVISPSTAPNYPDSKAERMLTVPPLQKSYPKYDTNLHHMIQEMLEE